MRVHTQMNRTKSLFLLFSTHSHSQSNNGFTIVLYVFLLLRISLQQILELIFLTFFNEFLRFLNSFTLFEYLFSLDFTGEHLRLKNRSPIHFMRHMRKTTEDFKINAFLFGGCRGRKGYVEILRCGQRNLSSVQEFLHGRHILDQSPPNAIKSPGSLVRLGHEILFDLLKPVKSESQVLLAHEDITNVLLADEVNTEQIVLEENCSFYFASGSIYLQNVFVDRMRV